MRSFSLGLLMATMSVMAAKALLEIRGLPSSSWRMPFRPRKVTKRAAALVPIRQGVVLDDEVEQVGGFVLYGRVDVLTAEALVDSTDGAI